EGLCSARREEQYKQAAVEGARALAAAKQRRLDRWHKGVAHIQSEAADVQRECGELFPAWDLILSDLWQAPRSLPPVLRLGQWTAGPAQFTEIKQIEEDAGPMLDELSMRKTTANGAIAGDEGLRLPVIEQPALLTFPERGSLLIRAQGKSRDQAVEIMQAAMLRLATTIPPGKVRFTVIDPVGLGQNFAAFMHLGDYDEQLIGARIWTEPQQIEQRLADLTEQMEVVIQKYLRNEFETIEAYNEAAGEVAEPFRYLVVANYPTNFSDSACRRLISIVSSGARCGVHALISVDTKHPMPQGFKISDLEQHCVNFAWQSEEEKFAWKDPDFGRLPLVLDKAPPGDVFSNIVRRVG
ncbi:MAG: FtsK/SpoIIIE domain-containing protein, partial [Candidatus Saccharimonadales bacterium]